MSYFWDECMAPKTKQEWEGAYPSMDGEDVVCSNCGYIIGWEEDDMICPSCGARIEWEQ